MHIGSLDLRVSNQVKFRILVYFHLKVQSTELAAAAIDSHHIASVDCFAIDIRLSSKSICRFQAYRQQASLLIISTSRQFLRVHPYLEDPALTVNERKVVEHFKENHQQDAKQRFVLPLPLNINATPLGESRTRSVRWLKTERSMHSKAQFHEFATFMQEYFPLGHAEMIPAAEQNKPHHETCYILMHAVWKVSSTTTKLRVVFDASAKTTSGASLNDHFLVGPTVHLPLIDVLISFRCHKIALTTDISKI